MKLYDVPDNTWVKVLEDIQVPHEGPGIKEGDIIFFRHIDGMYSFCTTHDEDEINTYDILHLIAWAEVIPVNK